MIEVLRCRESVETLSELPTCIASLTDNQTQQIDKIRTFAVNEIARQNLLTNATKVACERKLTILQTRLNEVRRPCIFCVTQPDCRRNRCRNRSGAMTIVAIVVATVAVIGCCAACFLPIHYNH